MCHAADIQLPFASSYANQQSHSCCRAIQRCVRVTAESFFSTRSFRWRGERRLRAEQTSRRIICLPSRRVDRLKGGLSSTTVVMDFRARRFAPPRSYGEMQIPASHQVLFAQTLDHRLQVLSPPCKELAVSPRVLLDHHCKCRMTSGRLHGESPSRSVYCSSV
jgi:hypothetical protein